MIIQDFYFVMSI